MKFTKGRDHAGEKNPASKLTWEKVRDIRRRVFNGETQRSVAKRYGVGHQNIGHIIKNKTWREDAISGS